MRFFAKMLAAALFCGTVIAGTSAMAQAAKVEYDPSVNFAKYKSYTLQKVHATDPSVEGAITIAVDRDLANRYLHPDAKNGDLIIAVVEATKDVQEYATFYDGLGGLSWQRGWGSGGFLDSTATLADIPVGSLILDMWDRKTQKLIWRGTLDETLTKSTDKNDQRMDKAVGQLVAQFPPKFKK